MDDLPEKSPAEVAIPVSELNRKVKSLLERGIAKLWVEGEISNIARPASGHLYFSLKDDTAVRSGRHFSGNASGGPTIGLKNGDQVLAFGRVSLYEPRGDYQLIVEQVEPAGEGALKREFDKLKRKLQAEGLFDASLKRELPVLPGRVGVITSPSGAAIRDNSDNHAAAFPERTGRDLSLISAGRPRAGRADRGTGHRDSSRRVRRADHRPRWRVPRRPVGIQ